MALSLVEAKSWPLFELMVASLVWANVRVVLGMSIGMFNQKLILSEGPITSGAFELFHTGVNSILMSGKAEFGVVNLRTSVYMTNENLWLLFSRFVRFFLNLGAKIWNSGLDIILKKIRHFLKLFDLFFIFFIYLILGKYFCE